MGKREDDDQHHSSSSSSTDSNVNSNSYALHHVQSNSHSTASPSYNSATTSFHDFGSKDLSTDLRLGLSISSHGLSSSSRGQYSDWPPMKALLRSTLAAEKSNSRPRRETLFVKVSMEGIPIGRKLDLLAHHGYHSLITTLVQMFRTTILSSDVICHDSPENCHILTYEDKEGDWMMVGDVPWEMFLTTVKRLKIVAFEKCQ
ncbi:auxin-responsive protein IAA31-like [Chenopodium quinoa]|nr:auxin-responsive protein IAA31-like [Chenopodium quinoa]